MKAEARGCVFTVQAALSAKGTELAGVNGLKHNLLRFQGFSGPRDVMHCTNVDPTPGNACALRRTWRNLYAVDPGSGHDEATICRGMAVNIVHLRTLLYYSRRLSQKQY